jgi:hypothetical protein
MAKQLEEALKRPATPVPPPQMAPIAPTAANDEIIDEHEDEDDDFLEPGPIGEPLAAYEEERDEEQDLVEELEADEQPAPHRPAVEPVRPAPSPLPPQPAEPASSKSDDKASDPFSVSEIEAEFARLLGRPLDTSKKG